MDENVENYDAILIRRDNPHFNEIIEQFDAFVHEMGDKPQILRKSPVADAVYSIGN